MHRKIFKNLLAVTAGLMMAAGLVVMGGNSIPANIVEASDLTLATDASKVTYRTTTAEEIAILKKLFDVEYYKAQNPELVELLGGSYKALFEHFCKYGVYEGRTCNANFDPSAYASAYSDLKSAFGTNILAYYLHYVNEGMEKGRTLTTVKACADAGVTVQSLADSEVVITPELYHVAETLKTNDYATLKQVVQRAAVEAAAVGGTAVISNGEESVAITDNEAGSSDSPAPSKAGVLTDEYKVAKTISLGEYFTIEVYKGGSGFGAWNHTFAWVGMDSTHSYNLITSTDGYEYTDPTYDGSGFPETTSLGTQVTSISVSANDASGEGASGAVITMSGDKEESNKRIVNGSKIEMDSDGYSYTLINDPRGTSSTQYEVGVKLEESNDGEAVNVSVAMEGNDGFGLVKDYNDVEAEPLVP